MKAFVLDTSALFALRYNESGADVVEGLLRGSHAKKSVCFVSFMSHMEYYYCLWRREGKAHALKAFLELKMLPIERVGEDEELILLAGEIKASYSMSLADSWVAATALRKGAKLVHKDPEFEPLSPRISLVTLPHLTAVPNNSTVPYRR